MRKHEHLMACRRTVVDAEHQPGKGPAFTGLTVYDPFEATYTCHSEYRRGKNFGDGGKFVCGDPEYFTSRFIAPETKCLVYSVGSSGDVSFEEEVVRTLGCEVFTFDPTGDSGAYKKNVEAVGGTFHAIGVSGVPSSMRNLVTCAISSLLPINDIINILDHTGRHIHILKIDCEDCEWDAFIKLWPQIYAGDISIGQIQIEMHGVDFSKIATFFDAADKAGYMIFNKESNPWCDGYKCFEFSLILKSDAERIFKFTHCNENVT
jgi:hypothetical protein